KVNVTDPNSSESYYLLWRGLLERYGESLFSGIASNTNSHSSSNSVQIQAVAAGESSIGVPSALSAVGRTAREGAPVAWVKPTDTIAYDTRILVPQADKGPHPAAARLFAN